VHKKSEPAVKDTAYISTYLKQKSAVLPRYVYISHHIVALGIMYHAIAANTQNSTQSAPHNLTYPI
jgi:hypothetical protein